MDKKGKGEGSGRTFDTKENGSRNVRSKESDGAYQIKFTLLLCLG